MEQQTSSHFTDEQQTVAEYTPFSFMSVLIFLIALIFAMIAVVNYKLIVLPIFGTILSVVMLVRLHAATFLPQSYLFAGAALFVSLFGFAFPVTYQSFRYRHLEATAIEHSQTWLDLVTSGRTLEAYEMSLEKKDQQPPGTDLKMIHGNVEQPSEDLKKYLNMQPEKTLRELGAEAKLTFEKVEYFRPHNRHDMFEVHYRLHRTGFEKDDYVFAMLMQRVRPVGPQGVYWEFRKLVPIRPAFARANRKIGVVEGQERELID